MSVRHLPVLAWTAVAVVAVGVSSCAKKPSGLKLTVLDPAPQRTLDCQFAQGYYSLGHAGTGTIALTGTGSLASEAPTSELMVIELLWQPRPGVTFTDPTGTNAKITYAVDLSGSVMVFRGAGFVRIRQNRSGTVLTGKIESSDLRSSVHSGVRGGQMRTVAITGTFKATKNAAQAVEQLRRARRHRAPALADP